MPDHTLSHLIILVSLCLLIPRFYRSLGVNKITAIPLLTGLTSLNYLNLSSNLITEIINRAFAGLTSLNFLYLDFNQITEINNGLFTGLTSLKELYYPRPRWRVPSFVSLASVSPTSPSLNALLSLYLLAIPLFMYTHYHTLYVPN